MTYDAPRTSFVLKRVVVVILRKSHLCFSEVRAGRHYDYDTCGRDCFVWTGDGEAQPEEDATSSMAVMMSAVATAGGGVGVAYVNTTFRTMGLLQFQDSNELADLEGVVIQVL